MIEFHQPQRLLKFSFLIADGAIGVDAKRSAIEQQLVLPAGPVGIQNRYAAFLDAGTHHVVAGFEFLEIVRRCIGDDDQRRTGLFRSGHRLREPDILTYQHGDFYAFVLEHKWLVSGVEVALLVKYLIVGQTLLQIGACDPPGFKQ